MSVRSRSSAITVLALDTDWFSRHGGVSTFNRKLCTALVGPMVKVYCAVRSPTPEEYAHADSVGVSLIAGWGDAHHRPRLPADVIPDVIISHGRITGPAAEILVGSHYPDATWLLIVHAAPDEVAQYKVALDEDAGLRAEKHSDIELSLARRATRVLAVGPRLYALYLRMLDPLPGVPEPLLINPGFDRTTTQKRSTPVGGPRQFLLAGRLDDMRVKGPDIAARAVAKAVHDLRATENEYELLLRGAPATGHDELRRTLLREAKYPLRIVTRSFSTDDETLEHDLRRATAMLMPSRAEAFGLSAVEAIAAGTPVLVSNRSGLGMLLLDLLPVEESRRIVVPVVDVEDIDTETWARPVGRIMADPDAAFVNAARLQGLLAERQTWAMAAAVVLQAAGLERTDTLVAHIGDGPRPARFAGRARLDFTRRLGTDWRELAIVLEIDDYEVHRFAAGSEPGEIWEWLHRRRRLHELPAALRTIGREGLANMLEASEAA